MMGLSKSTSYSKHHFTTFWFYEERREISGVGRWGNGIYSVPWKALRGFTELRRTLGSFYYERWPSRRWWIFRSATWKSKNHPNITGLLCFVQLFILVLSELEIQRSKHHWVVPSVESTRNHPEILGSNSSQLDGNCMRKEALSAPNSRHFLRAK